MSRFVVQMKPQRQVTPNDNLIDDKSLTKHGKNKIACVSVSRETCQQNIIIFRCI